MIAIDAEKIADEILNDICRYYGGREWWEGFCEETQEEIKETWMNIVKRNIEEAQQPPA